MKRLLRGSWALGLWVLGLPALVAAAEWRRGEAENYVILTDDAGPQLEAMVAQLEQLRAGITSFLKLDPAMPGRIRIVAFRHHDDYVRFQKKERVQSIGVVAHALVSYHCPTIFLSLTEARQNEARWRRIVFHEFVHVIYSQRLRPLPQWFNEGIADYLATAELQPESCRFGAAFPERMTELLHSGLRFEEVFVSPASPAYRRAVERGLYAQRWLFVHYCLRGDASDRAALFNLLERLEGGAAMDEATFRAAFGVGFAEMEKREARYRSEGVFRRQTVTTPRVAPPTVAWVPLSAFERDVLMAEGAALGRPTDEAEAALENLVRREAQSLAARIALAHAALRLKHGAKECEALLAASELPGCDPRVLARAAEILLHPPAAEGEPPVLTDEPPSDRIRQLCREALRRQPRCFLAAEVLASAESFVAEPDWKTVALAESLLEAMDEPEATLLALARLRLRNGETARAAELAQRVLTRLATPPRLRTQAERILSESMGSPVTETK